MSKNIICTIIYHTLSKRIFILSVYNTYGSLLYLGNKYNGYEYGNRYIVGAYKSIETLMDDFKSKIRYDNRSQQETYWLEKIYNEFEII